MNFRSEGPETYAAGVAICGCLVLPILVFALAIVPFLTVICAIHHRPYFVNLDGVQANSTTTSATNNTLNYALDLSISLRNPNKFYNVHHNKIQATSFYKDSANALLVTVVNLNSFSQKPKSNAVIASSFKGVISPHGDDHEVENLLVKLYLENKYKTRFMGWEAMSEFECDLKLPSINKHSFETTTDACKVIFHRRLSFPKPLKVYFFFLIWLLLGRQWLSYTLATAAFIWFLVIV